MNTGVAETGLTCSFPICEPSGEKKGGEGKAKQEENTLTLIQNSPYCPSLLPNVRQTTFQNICRQTYQPLYEHLFKSGDLPNRCQISPWFRKTFPMKRCKNMMDFLNDLPKHCQNICSSNRTVLQAVVQIHFRSERLSQTLSKHLELQNMVNSRTN